MQLNSVAVKSPNVTLDYKHSVQSQPKDVQTDAGVQTSIPQSETLQSDNLKPAVSNPLGTNAAESDEEKKAKLENTVESVNKFLEPSRSSIQFQLHDDTGEYYVQVVNSSSGEVIREIPSEQMLDLRYAVEKYLGILIDEKI